jgi:integrase
MRRGEALGLRWSDVDFDSARVQVYQQLVRQGDRVGFGSPKTKAGRRNIALTGDTATIAALRAQEAVQKPNKLKCGPAYQTDLDLVFCRPEGSPLDADIISQQFERAVSRARLKRITFHGLRHTHATLALQAGIHPKVVQQRLGHSSVMVTLDRYSHAIPAMEEEAAGRIAALVDGL